MHAFILFIPIVLGSLEQPILSVAELEAFMDECDRGVVDDLNGFLKQYLSKNPKHPTAAVEFWARKAGHEIPKSFRTLVSKIRGNLGVKRRENKPIFTLEEREFLRKLWAETPDIHLNTVRNRFRKAFPQSTVPSEKVAGWWSCRKYRNK